ncbi:uncharacterized protein LOC115035057 [Acyrthosiphon pisum]|nr:uncharacterized protein LOC115035057 [Acyrthosiphon pisum]
MESSTSLNDSHQTVHSPPTTSKTKKTKFDRVSDLLIENKDARIKLIETLNNKKMYCEEDDIDTFYKSIAMSVKRLPPSLRAEAKMQHLQILSNLEMKNIQNEHQQLAYSQPPRQIDNATIQTFNPTSFESYPPAAHQQQGYYQL